MRAKKSACPKFGSMYMTLCDYYPVIGPPFKMVSGYIPIRIWTFRIIRKQKRLPSSAAVLFFVGVIEIQAHIYGNHGEIQDIHSQDIPYDIAAEDLAKDAT